MKKILLAFLFLALTCSNLYALPPEIRFDILKSKLTEQLTTDDREGILATLGEMKELGVPLPHSFAYFEGKALFESGRQAQAYEKLETYVVSEGKKGKYYSKAIAYLAKAEPYVVKEERTDHEDGTYTIYELDSFGNGKTTTYLKNGIKNSFSLWKNWKLNKLMVFYFENGEQSYIGEYLNGEKHGAEIYYYENGKFKSSGTYENGKLVGELTTYPENKD